MARKKTSTKARKGNIPPIEIPSALESSFPDDVLEKAKKLAKRKKTLLAEGERLKEEISRIKGIDDLLDLPVAEEDPEQRIVFILALMIACAEEAQVRDCDCLKELAALQAAQARLQRAFDVLQQAQANLANAEAQLAAATAAERAAWQAYAAASRLAQRLCRTIVGRFLDPLCLISITYATLVGNKWRIRQQQLQNAQQAVLNAQRVVRQAETLLQQAQQRFSEALLAYILCLLRCLFGF